MYVCPKLPPKYANFRKHKWSKFVIIKISDFEKGTVGVGKSQQVVLIPPHLQTLVKKESEKM